MTTTFVCPAGLHCPAGLDRQPDLVSHKCPKGQYCVRGDEVCVANSYSSLVVFLCIICLSCLCLIF